MKSNKGTEYKRRNKRKDVNRPWLTALKSGLKELKLFNFIMLAIAGCINAFGVTVFLFPVKLYDSGISGLSMLLDQVTPSFLTLSLFLLILNIPIFIFGLSRQGQRSPFTQSLRWESIPSLPS